MKTKLITILGIVLLATLVTGGILANLDKSVELTKPQKDALAQINLSSYETIDSDLGNNMRRRCLSKPGAINTCKVFNVTGMNSVNISTTLDDWEKKRIEGIADVRIKRNDNSVIEVGNGTTTIAEKK